MNLTDYKTLALRVYPITDARTLDVFNDHIRDIINHYSLLNGGLANWDGYIDNQDYFITILQTL